MNPHAELDETLDWILVLIEVRAAEAEYRLDVLTEYYHLMADWNLLLWELA